MNKFPKYNPTQFLIDAALPTVKRMRADTEEARILEGLQHLFGEYWHRWSHGKVQSPKGYAPYGVDTIEDELVAAVNIYSSKMFNELRLALVEEVKAFQKYDMMPVAIWLPRDLCLLLDHQELTTIHGLRVVTASRGEGNFPMLMSPKEYGRFLYLERFDR